MTSSIPALDIITLVHSPGKEVGDKLVGLEKAVQSISCCKDDAIPVRVLHHARSSAMDWCLQQLQSKASASLPAQHHARLWSILSSLLHAQVRGLVFVSSDTDFSIPTHHATCYPLLAWNLGGCSAFL
jgi:hypothetical protein